jgi:CRP-like cAMP-binding protein
MLDQLLHLSSKERPSEDVAMLRELTSDISFFKRLVAKLGHKAHLAYCNAMTVVSFKAGDYVFKCGDIGDVSFVILQGTVAVMVPIRPAGFRTFKRMSFGDFHWDTQPQSEASLGATVRRSSATPIRRPSGMPDSGMIEQEVRTLGRGETFGELALLTDKPRAASILAKTDLTLAQLVKSDYLAILQELEAEQLNRKIAFFQSIPIFQDWTKQSLKKLTYYIKTERFKQGSVVYLEDAPSTDVFIVRQGEFKFYRQVKLKLIDRPGSRAAHERSSPSQRLRSSGKLKLHAYIKGTREVFGADDIIEGRPRQMTCECCSTKGTLYVISKKDFIHQVQKSNSWEYLVQAHDQQEAWQEQKLQRLDRAEAMFNQLGRDQPPQGFRLSESRDKKSRASRERPAVCEASRGTRLRSNSVLDLQGLSSVSPARKLESRVSSVTDRKQVGSARNLSLKMSFKHFHSRRGSFEWKHKPLPPGKSVEFRASKPPPNFFAQGKQAIESRYKHSPSIAGKPLLQILLSKRPSQCK